MQLKLTLSRAPLAMEFEFGSVADALAGLQENKEKLIEVLDLATDMSEASGGDAPQTGTAIGTTDEAPATARRGRKPKATLDPATATAPAPAPIPSAPPAPVPPLVPAPALAEQVATAAADGKIPPFLDRAAAAPVPPTAPAAPTAPVAPPAPPVVAAPPVVPAAAPPTGVLAQKILAEVDRRSVGSPDNGAGINDWLRQSMVACQLVQAIATVDEARSVLPFQTDDKLTSIAQQLQIA